MPSVYDLRRMGWKVRVIHIRHENPRPLFIDPSPYDPKGGETILEINDVDGNYYEGRAICSPKDNYNRKMGVKIALGRALVNSKVEA